MMANEFGQSCIIEIEFFCVLMYNNILLMDVSLLAMVVSSVKVELIDKKAGDGKLYCINCNYTLFQQ